MNYQTKRQLSSLLLATVVFVLALYCVTIKDLDGLARMPGGLGDSRLNNIFLENVWQVLVGRSESFIHLPFFWPFPYVVGFSDNLWGSAPFYVMWRGIGYGPMEAFQFWYYSGFVLNFFGMFWVLRKLGFSISSSIVSSLFYAFCLPGLAQAIHVQLHYRFAIPFAVYFCGNWLREGDAKAFVWAALWMVWQFWIGIYMGIFLLLLLISIVATAVVRKVWQKSLKRWGRMCLCSVRQHLWTVLIGMCVSAVMMVVLLYPYMIVSWLYGSHREWSEISTMLPRVSSYFLMDFSDIYGFISKKLAQNIPMRHEHQLFIGVIPMVLLVLGILVTRDTRNLFLSEQTLYTAKLCKYSLSIIVVLTLYVSGYSLWWFMAKIPLFNATRAMSRIVLVLIFPVAVLIAAGVEGLMRQAKKAGTFIFVIILASIICETACLSSGGNYSREEAYSSLKANWIDREKKILETVPITRVSKDSVLFFAQTGTPVFSEVDAMWVSQKLGLRTMNGYSGFLPTGLSWQYERNSNEAINRVFAGIDKAERVGDKNFGRFSLLCIGFSGQVPDLQQLMKNLLVNAEYIENFSKNSVHKIKLSQGFSWREAWGVWIDGNKAVLRFSVGQSKPQRVRLWFNVFGDSLHAQRVCFSVNGTIVLQKQFPPGSSFVELPLNESENVEIQFDCPDAISPKMLKMSGDDRKLSIGLVKAEFL